MEYSAAQAARLSHCTSAQLRHWTRTGLVGNGDPAAGYHFRDLVVLRVVRSLLEAGVPSARVRAAIQAIRSAGDDLARLRIITDGRSVWACHSDGEILDALRAGQLALFVGVDQMVAAVDADVRGFTQERAAFVEQLVADAR